MLKTIRTVVDFTFDDEELGDAADVIAELEANYLESGAEVFFERLVSLYNDLLFDERSAELEIELVER